ncbi:MAG TPA: nicotinamide-nucleotide adenylyltransferase [Nitrososphaeraceae archaeon]|nr:nicotinamide-nucleotide adenylyltransferase [Nitrososphaeraceae archaeon]
MYRGLFIGRFQPLHLGHITTIKFALKSVDQLTIVVGSADKSHEARNPFTAGERIEMIKDSLDNDCEIDIRKILIIPVPDLGVHALWTKQIELVTPRFEAVFSNDPLTNILFKERGIRLIEPHLSHRKLLSATEIRSRIVKGKSWQKFVTPQTVKVIQDVGGIRRIKTLFASKAYMDTYHVSS